MCLGLKLYRNPRVNENVLGARAGVGGISVDGHVRIILATAAAIAIDTLRGLADQAQATALQNRANTIQQAIQ